MIKRAYILFCLCAILSAAPKEVYNLDDLASGADAFGRGGAYLATEDSSNYVFQNYSLLGKGNAPRIALTTFQLISELNYLAAAYSYGNWGLGILTLNDNGGLVRDEDNNVLGGKIGYSNTTFYGAYGRQLTDKFFLGTRLKYHSIVFSEVDSSASGTGLDLTTTYQAQPYLILSSELNNLLATPLKWSDGSAESQPLSLRLGNQLKLAGQESLIWKSAAPINLYADVLVDQYNDFWSGGVEYQPVEYVALRAGLRQTADVADRAGNTFTRLTAGVGFNWSNIHIDYAYNPGDDLADNLTHFFTLSYRFRAPTPKIPEPEFRLEVEEIREPRPPRERMFVDLNALPLREQALIEDLGYLGLVEGYPGKLYEPNENMTRRELMLVLVRLLEREKREPADFSQIVLAFPDIAERDKKVAEKAIGYGLLSGYPDGKVHLEEPVRRDEAIVAFARYYEISGQILLEDSTYADVPENHWGYKDINLAKQYSLTQDIENFIPKEYLRRVEAARILGRIQYIKDVRAELAPLAGITEEDWAQLLNYDMAQDNYLAELF